MNRSTFLRTVLLAPFVGYAVLRTSVQTKPTTPLSTKDHLKFAQGLVADGPPLWGILASQPCGPAFKTNSGQRQDLVVVDSLNSLATQAELSKEWEDTVADARFTPSPTYWSPPYGCYEPMPLDTVLFGL